MEMLMKDPFNNISESSKHILDGLSLVTVLGPLVDILPAIAAAFTIIWTAIRIYETETVQDWINRAKRK